MDKVLIVINGKGGVGKDTLCDFAARHFKTRNISSVTPIKEIAKAGGWKGEKDAKARTMLSDLKKVFTEYNEIKDYDRGYKVFLHTYHKDGLLYTFVTDPGVDTFSFYYVMTENLADIEH